MQTAIREEFTYLNRIRESGEVNMFGAAPYKGSFVKRRTGNTQRSRGWMPTRMRISCG